MIVMRASATRAHATPEPRSGGSRAATFVRLTVLQPVGALGYSRKKAGRV